MRRYGDSLLRAMTFCVLGDLFGSENISTITNVISFAVSNAFYEKLFLHYKLDKLCISYEGIHKSPKAVAAKRGDVLESYMAAIEMDFSRSGEGHREVCEWLSKVLTLRLKKVLETHSHSLTRTSKVSPKLIWPDCYGVPQTSPLPTDDKIEPDYRRHPSSITSRASVRQIQLHRFRTHLFEKMRELVCQSSPSTPWQVQVKTFWVAMKSHLDDLQNAAFRSEDTNILLWYYRVPPPFHSDYVVLRESTTWVLSFCP
jgi:hypothetical protein